MKWIAALLMVLDHIGYYLEGIIPDEVNLILRIVGRLSFPLFAYSVAAGYQQTRNKRKYFARMFLCALITELLLYLSHLITGIPFGVNVLFTFSLSILCLFLIESILSAFRNNGSQIKEGMINRGEGKKQKRIMTILLSLTGLAVIIFLTIQFTPEYHLFGIASVIFFYFARKKVWKGSAVPDIKIEPEYSQSEIAVLTVSYFILNVIWMVLRILLLGVSPQWSIIQTFSAAAILIIPAVKNRERPKRWEKYFFYIFYPAHLVLFFFLRYAFLQTRS